MAIRIAESVQNSDTKESKITAFLSASSELTTLGTKYAAGSLAIVVNAVDGMKPYILSPSKIWVEV